MIQLSELQGLDPIRRPLEAFTWINVICVAYWVQWWALLAWWIRVDPLRPRASARERFLCFVWSALPTTLFAQFGLHVRGMDPIEFGMYTWGEIALSALPRLLVMTALIVSGCAVWASAADSERRPQGE